MGADQRRDDPPLGRAEGGAERGGAVVTGVRFATTKSEGGKLVETGETFTLAADMVLKAIGQTFMAEPVGMRRSRWRAGRIRTDEDGRTARRSGPAATAATAGATSPSMPSSTARSPLSIHAATERLRMAVIESALTTGADRSHPMAN
jgi:NADPH-dependent glutamate synthase beta subunit-like oxidoreductase